VAYDGTDFHGWQRQPGLRTVQGVLESCLGAALGEPVRLTGAGRTDAGCHARGQVASFTTRVRVPGHAIAPMLRRHLPLDLEVKGSRETETGFDARRSARARRYAYRLLDHPDVLLARLAWCPPRRAEADALQRAVRSLEGSHDCAAFAASGCSATRTECVVHRIAWRRWEGGLVLDIVADHFLYHMVRNVVGTAVAIAGARDPGRAMTEIVAAGQRSKAGATAPPQGLSLEEVFYPAEAA